jgi:hypothetical protein
MPPGIEACRINTAGFSEESLKHWHLSMGAIDFSRIIKIIMEIL